MTKEQKFYKALQDVFIGAKIEGQGGFVNLMKIKSNYYQKIEKFLKDDIEKALEKYPSFREELFDKLYSFFSRYFTESGSIYFNSTPFHNNVYEKVYTDDKDVILFWKTQMLYYVKTDRIFKSMPIEFDNYKFYFDATTIENKKANEKRSLIYEINEIKEDKTIVFNVYYSEKGRVTKTEEILKELKKSQISIDEEKLERAFRIFEKQSEVDFFINKNAKAFLQEQFKLWSYQYFWEGAKEWTADRVKELQILKDIAFKIIDFISQFEDELVKIWNKPKFVKNSNYVITLDRINNLELIEKILNHQNINEQVKEWQELGIVDDAFKTKDVFETDIYGKKLTKKYEHLPIDTKYFKDLEFEILSLFDDLDNSLDGWLIKSENYQALNTILPKFKEKVQTIYIDPPFNLDSSDQFLYRTNYKDANWATLLENRIRIAKDWLNEKGSIFVRCDYNGNWIVRCLMDEIFGKDNFRNEIVISRISKQDPKVQKFNTATDSLFFYSKTDAFQFNLLFKQLAKAKAERWHAMDSQGQGQPLYIFDYLFDPPKGRHWT
jgi:Adenine specific DNA methylase Mod